MNAELLVPILVPLGICALIFGLYYLKNRENMALIERGINPRQQASQPKPFVNLKYGLLLVGSGIGLVVAYLLDRVLDPPVIPTDHIYNPGNPALYFALVAIGGGLGLIISYRIEKKQWLDKQHID